MIILNARGSDDILSVFTTIFKRDDKLPVPQKAMLQKCVNYVLRRADASMDILMNLLAANPEIVKVACSYDEEYFSERFQSNTKNRVR